MQAVRNARSVIVAAKPYLTDDDPPRPDRAAGPQARVGRYAWVDHYAPLRTALRDVAKRIRRADHRAVAFADDNSIVDRAVAHRAGLGWYGKNANLLLPGAGSWFVLGSIVTTAEYEPSPGPASDGCGSCVRCIDACPTDAIVAPGVIDANRCISWILQKPGSIPDRYRTAIGDRIYGCDDCQDACPISVRLGRRNTIELDERADAWVDAIELLDADDQWIDDRYGHWYVTNREFRWVRRNALVVIGNVADPADGRVQRVVDALPFAHRPDSCRTCQLGCRPSPRAVRVWSSPVKHLLVTNDFPPKIGGIQSLLWEWWRRLPPSRSPCSRAHTRAPPSSMPASRIASNAPANRSCCRIHG